MKYLLLLILLFLFPIVSAAETCQSLGNPTNCVELWPQQSGDFYTYNSEFDFYILDDTDSDDYYFLLMDDLSCERSCIIPRWVSRQNTQYTTTIDLNGYTLTYSDSDYSTLQNNGFEEWNANQPLSWEIISGTVEPRSTDYYMPMSGDWVLYTDDSLVIESSMINLPLGNREYMAYVTLGRAAASDITIEVLDANDNVVCSITEEGFFRGKSFGCEFMPGVSGMYKMRISTLGYAYIDRTGIVPVNDYGIVTGSNYGLTSRLGGNYPGYTFIGSWDVPNISQYDEVRPILEVKNGNIRTGSENIISYALRTSSAPLANFHDLDIRVMGLQSHTIGAYGRIVNNYLEVDMPWYFARENSIEENIIVAGGVVQNNTLIGGQGVIRLEGTGTLIEGNYLRNNAQATNHYAIIHGGAENPIIKNNIFDPIEGSGILTFSGHGYKIYNNTFYVNTATCNVEYVNEDYSTNAIRMNDYGSGANHDNEVINNTFYIVGRDFDTAWDNCMPVTTGIFYSASGANNKIWNNKFYLTKTWPGDNSPVFAFYIGGDAYNTPENNRLFVNNYVETNDKALWINSFYGDSANQWLENNTFVKVANEYYTPSAETSAIRMGYYRMPAPNIRLINNHFLNGFDEDHYYFTATTDTSLYDIHKQWYVNINVLDGSGNPVPNALVHSTSSVSFEQVQGITDQNGFVRLYLTEYVEEGDMRSSGPHIRTDLNPHSFYVLHEDYLQEFGPFIIDQETDLTLSMNFGASCSVEGETIPCGLSEGECSQGVQTCTGGVWSSCVGASNPMMEICDGFDNDCDSLVDEDLGTTTCGLGACDHTINNCVDGIVQVCDAFEGANVETPLVLCGDGIDNDCDGFELACSYELIFSETSDELICNIADPLGISKVELLIDSGSGLIKSDEISNTQNNNYYFIEAEDFFYDISDWDVCPDDATNISNNDCEDDRVSLTNYASGLAHVVSDDGIAYGNITDMTFTNNRLVGDYYVWARSYQRSSDISSRVWSVGSDSQFSSNLQTLGTNSWAWESAGLISFVGNVYIRDASPDGLWTYPDLVLLTDDSNFNPSVDCDVDLSNLQPREYSLGSCGVVPTSFEARFSKPDGVVDWSCNYVNGKGELIGLESSVGALNEFDLNADGFLNLSDLVLFTNSFGVSGISSADFNNDGIVNVLDMVLLSNAYFSNN